MKHAEFGQGFSWGVASAAYQIEGAHNVHGKGPSIWDHFTVKPGTVFQGHDGQVACDFYNRYEEDLDLMRRMHIPNYRFSLSWPRVLPSGTGTVSYAGMAFYDRLIDCCLEKGITPWVTLYHWDLPQALQDKGGWGNRDILGWFGEYVALCAQRYGDRVKHWMVLNEPMVFTGAGYFLGVHAPGEKGLKSFLPALHHAVVCQGEGGRILREICPGASIGTTFSCSYITPRSLKRKDIRAAIRVDALLNKLFLEPALGLGYPIEDLNFLRKLEPYIGSGDMVRARFDFDFIGLQNYTREVVGHSWLVPHLKAKIIKAEKRKVPVTLMDWEIYPQGIYHMIRRFASYEGIRRIVITENGAAFRDIPDKGSVNDLQRLAYIRDYLEQVLRAKKEGAPVSGYFIWTFTDNFEWAEGYFPRFGLVYTDFPSQKRIVKASGKWFAEFLSDPGS